MTETSFHKNLVVKLLLIALIVWKGSVKIMEKNKIQSYTVFCTDTLLPHCKLGHLAVSPLSDHSNNCFSVPQEFWSGEHPNRGLCDDRHLPHPCPLSVKFYAKPGSHITSRSIFSQTQTQEGRWKCSELGNSVCLYLFDCGSCGVDMIWTSHGGYAF